MSDMATMTARFSAPSTRVVYYAQEEAKSMGLALLDTGHLLIGLIMEGRGVAAQVLLGSGITLDQVRAEYHRLTRDAPPAPYVDRLTLDKDAKAVIEETVRLFNASHPDDWHVETEHLLLGLLSKELPEKNLAMNMLAALNVDSDALTSALLASKESRGNKPMSDTWAVERFSDPVTKVIHYARKEAIAMELSVLDTGHLLLGLIREGQGAAAQVLLASGITLELARAEYLRLPRDEHAVPPDDGRVSLGKGAKAVIEQSVRIAKAVQPDGWHVDTEHLLLGLINKNITGNNRAMKMLTALHVDPEALTSALHVSLPDRVPLPAGQSGAKRTGKPRGWFAYVVIALCCAVFALTIFTEGGSIIGPSSSSLMHWGALNGPAVAEGEWWRMISSAFLHASYLHLLLKIVAVYMFIPLLEQWQGRWRVIGLYCYSAITGSLLSLWWHPAGSSVGASGALFGMLGVYFAVLIRHRDVFHPEYRKYLKSRLTSLLAYNLLFSLLPGINMAAHLGGLIGGLALGLIITRPPLSSSRLTRREWVFTGLLLAITACGFLGWLSFFKVS